jgi:SP family general alpha glucoside:H+ symporter-like MFS transporter
MGASLEQVREADRLPTSHSESTKVTATVGSLTEVTFKDAMQIDHSENLLLGEAVKKYPSLVKYFMLLSCTVVLWGYDGVVVGSITGVPAFQRDYGEIFEGEYIIPAVWLSLWLAASPIGSVFGSPFGGWLQDRIGRKRTLTFGTLLVAVGVTMLFTSYLPSTIASRRGLFLAGKIVEGFAIGLIKVFCLTYVSENAPTSLRGPAMALFPTGTLIGQLIGSVVVFVIEDNESPHAYSAALGSQWAVACFPFVLSIFLPESPSYCVRKGRLEEAKKSAEKLYASKADPTEMLARIKVNVEREALEARDVTFGDCFSQVHRRRMWIIIFENLVPTLFGLNLLSTASYFLQICGMDSSDSLIFLIAGVVAGLIANGISIWTLSRVGRRSISLSTLAISTVLFMAMGIAGIFPDASATPWVTGVCLIAIIVTCGSGAWPAGYAIMAETSSLRLRAKSQAIGALAAELSSIAMNFILPYVFSPDAGNARALTGWLFVGLCGIAVFTTYLWVPEMKGRTVAEIDEMFHLGIAAKDFKNWKAEDNYSTDASA